jgi:hypothetical protein
MAEPKSGASIIVRNVAPSTNPPTQKVLADFFVFCGNITALSILPDKDERYDDALTAVITFESEAAAKTAQLLSNALINDRPIVVELAPVNFKAPPSRTNIDTTIPAPGDQNTEPSVFSSIMSVGEKISTEVITQAKSLDEQTGVTQTISSGFGVITAAVSQFDTQYQISDKARALGESVKDTAKMVDQQYEISTKATDVGNQVGGFLTVATNTAASGVETAKVALDSIVESPPVAMGIETVKLVSNSITGTIGAGFNALFGTGTTNK